MKGKRKILKVTGILFLFFMQSKIPGFAQGQGVYSWDFVQTDIKDILFAVSLDTGISIVPDDTVEGKTDFKFVGKDFIQAFDSFLNSSRLYVVKKNELWTVSKIRINKEDDLYSVDACDLEINRILEKISLESSSVITYEVLPANKINFHIKNVTEKELLQRLCLESGGYEVEFDDKGSHITKKRIESSNNRNNWDKETVLEIEINKDKYSINTRNAVLSQVLEELFKKESAYVKRDFCILGNGDVKISRTSFCSNNFDDALEQLCFQNGYSFEFNNGIYFIWKDGAPKEKLNLEKQNWVNFNLENIKAEKFLTYLNAYFGKIESLVNSDNFSFMAKVSEADKTKIEELIKQLDVVNDSYTLELKNMKPVEFIKLLPPGFDRKQFFYSENSSFLYFDGSKKEYDLLLQQQNLFDKPVQRISYDLLILQYDQTLENNWSNNFGIRRISLGDRNTGSFKIGSVLNLNMNVISAFGLDFAENLQLALENNQTTVYADTTLHGVMGKEISFQNTNTYRYRDNNLDPETGKPVYSGVTREIVSGLKLEVVGNASGEGMITSKVTASIARQGTDTSSSTGNPPPTSEKIVTTEVRGRSGEPVVLSGLIENARTVSQRGIPWFYKIPVLGWFFKDKNQIQEETQMTIYLVPHVEEYEEASIKIDEKTFLMECCKKLMEVNCD